MRVGLERHRTRGAGVRLETETHGEKDTRAWMQASLGGKAAGRPGIQGRWRCQWTGLACIQWLARGTKTDETQRHGSPSNAHL